VTTLAAFGDWLTRYQAAWRSNSADDIRALFADDAVYRWNPFGRPTDEVIGREAIVAAWLEKPDDRDTWQMECWPLAVEGSLGVARCRTEYNASKGGAEAVYHNVWLIQLTDDGRCSDFTEIWMKQPDPAPA